MLLFICGSRRQVSPSAGKLQYFEQYAKPHAAADRRGFKSPSKHWCRGRKACQSIMDCQPRCHDMLTIRGCILNVTTEMDKAENAALQGNQSCLMRPCNATVYLQGAWVAV